MSGIQGSNSIQGQMLSQLDNNADGNANNDIDDFMHYNWAKLASGEKLELTLNSLSESKGYTFAIEDKLTTEAFSSGTNFAGATGMHRFFDGNDASDIELNNEMQTNPTLMSAGYTDVAGDNRLASNMIQHQFERFDFSVDDNTIYNATTYGMYDIIATNVGIQTNSAIMKSETTNAQFNAVELEYFSVSKVSIDEEMTNLIKYQTAYGASAKVITTIDQMMQTLLGIKQ